MTIINFPSPFRSRWNLREGVSFKFFWILHEYFTSYFTFFTFFPFLSFFFRFFRRLIPDRISKEGKRGKEREIPPWTFKARLKKFLRYESAGEGTKIGGDEKETEGPKIGSSREIYIRPTDRTTEVTHCSRGNGRITFAREPMKRKPRTNSPPFAINFTNERRNGRAISPFREGITVKKIAKRRILEKGEDQNSFPKATVSREKGNVTDFLVFLWIEEVKRGKRAAAKYLFHSIPLPSRCLETIKPSAARIRFPLSRECKSRGTGGNRC